LAPSKDLTGAEHLGQTFWLRKEQRFIIRTPWGSVAHAGVKRIRMRNLLLHLLHPLLYPYLPQYLLAEENQLMLMLPHLRQHMLPHLLQIHPRQYHPRHHHRRCRRRRR